MAKRKKAKTKLNLGSAEFRKVVASFEKQAEKIVADLSVGRDKLRELVEKYSDMLESIDDGIDGFEDYLCNFEHCIDRMSEQI